MSPLVLSACLMSSLTRPLSPAEVRSRPEPGSLAFGLYAIRVACSVRKGMTQEEVKAILGREDFGFAAGGRRFYTDPGLIVRYGLRRPPVVGGVVQWDPGVRPCVEVTEVGFFSLRAFRLRFAR
jgi:hypothetical protein